MWRMAINGMSSGLKNMRDLAYQCSVCEVRPSPFPPPARGMNLSRECSLNPIHPAIYRLALSSISNVLPPSRIHPPTNKLFALYISYYHDISLVVRLMRASGVCVVWTFM